MRWLWERLFGKADPHGTPENAAPDMAANDDDVLDDVRSQIRGDVAAGFSDREEIIDSAIEVHDGEVERSILERHVPQWVDEELDAHALRQQAWPSVTDCDRLDAAFKALEENGVISRHHFTCCGTCGSSEIWDEIAAAEQAGIEARGYAFYHWQDTEHAVEGHGIYLNYGARDGTESSAVDVAHEIVTELKRSGLKTDWDGDFGKRIGVKLDWKRRRVA